MKRYRLAWPLLLLLASLGGGCTTSMRVNIESSAQTNGGRPLYVMIRKIDGKTFISENYEAVSAKVFAYPQDPTVLQSEIVVPGRDNKLSVRQDDDSDLAIYFFFTAPGKKWRLPLNQPVPAELFIELGSNQIKRVQVRRR